MSQLHTIPRLILRVPVETADAEANQPALQELFQDLAGAVKQTDTVHVYFPASYLRRQPSGQSAAFIERALTAHGVAPEQIVLKLLEDRQPSATVFRKREAPERIIIEVNELAA